MTDSALAKKSEKVVGVYFYHSGNYIPVVGILTDSETVPLNLRGYPAHSLDAAIIEVNAKDRQGEKLLNTLQTQLPHSDILVFASDMPTFERLSKDNPPYRVVSTLDIRDILGLVGQNP